MNQEKLALLTKLIHELADSSPDLIPIDTWFALHRLVPLPAVEVLITRNNGREFLLTYRSDKFWEGWHIPGGFIKLKDQSLVAACNRIARDEIGISGVHNLRLVTVIMWATHAYGGSPVSILYSCLPNEEVRETKEMRFFSSIPHNMISHHTEFIECYIQKTTRNF